MDFTIKEREATKCASCVHAFRIKPYSAPNTLTICRLLNTPVGKIEQCNYHLTLSQTGPPPHMLMDAWMIDLERHKRTGRVVGFKVQPPTTIDELKEEIKKDSDFI